MGFPDLVACVKVLAVALIVLAAVNLFHLIRAMRRKDDGDDNDWGMRG